MTSWQPPMIQVATHRFRTFCPQESSIPIASQIIRPCVLTDSLESVEQPCGPVRVGPGYHGQYGEQQRVQARQSKDNLFVIEPCICARDKTITGHASM
jgi:hypothetical protein